MFLPFALVNQFKRVANIYFLFIAILYCFDDVTPVSPWSAIIPLIFVLMLSLIREGVENHSKTKHDSATNSQKTVQIES